MIYLDNAATTPIYPEVVSQMAANLAEIYGNPSSIHAVGRDAARLLRNSREKTADILEVPASTLTFTSGATEANNTALIGYALEHIDAGRHIVTTSIEHPSVLEAMRYLEQRFGFSITTVTPDRAGNLTAARILSAVKSDTILVSVMMANNETGQILPVQEIGAILAKLDRVAFHVDAVQALGKIPVKPREIGANFLTATAHKFHGPKGVGLLYHSSTDKFDGTQAKSDRVSSAKSRFDGLLHGGDQESKHRAGTENLISIAAMAQSLDIATSNLTENLQNVQALHNQLLSNLTGLDYYENRFGDRNLPHVLNLGFPGIRNDLLLTQLDLAGIAISTGSACTAGTVKPSHVLESVYNPDSPRLHENIRISLSELNQPAEIDEFTHILKGLL